jgi:hypothetical protein
MLCCGIVAMVAAIAFGTWRRVRARPGALLFVGLTGALLVTGAVVLFTAGAADRGAPRLGMLQLAMASLCSVRSDGTQVAGDKK